MSEWKTGDRVQAEQDDTIKVGEVVSVEMHQVERSRYDYRTHTDTKYMETEIKSVKIKWDTGEEESLSQWDIHEEDSDIEREFRLTFDSAQKRIDEKLAIASAALDEAVAISEETGVPFSAYISPLSQSYLPNSFSEKFPELDSSFANEMAGAYGEYEGWQHSAVC